MKRSMDAGTILYIGEDFSLAYHTSLLKDNYYIDPYQRCECEILDKRIQNATDIYYKVNDNLNSWVKYEYAIQTYEGTIEERLEKALRNPNMTLSRNLIEIPQTIYQDADRRIHVIHPNDGKSLNHYWAERIDGLLDQPKYKLTRRQVNYIVDDLNEMPVYALDLSVTFSKPIKDAIITLNNFFLEYEQVSDTEVLFMDIENFMTRAYQFDDDKRFIENPETEDYYRDENGLVIPFNIKHYDFEAGVYLWNGIKKQKKIKPVMMKDNMLIFNEKVGKHGFLTYNGLLYSYELYTKGAEEDTRILLSYDEFDPELIQYTRFCDFQLTEMGLDDDENEKLEVKRYNITGVNNILPDEVEFTKKIRNAMITCNHVDFSYHLCDARTIKYPMDSTNGPQDSLSNDTPVNATFIMVGTKGYNSAGEADTVIENNTDNDVVIKREDSAYLNDYHDILTFRQGAQIFLYTNYRPIENTIRLFINGVKYDEGVHFNYDIKSKSIIWTFSSEFGGFDLKPEYNYTAVYDLSFYQNNITNITKFVSDYKVILKKIKLGLI